MRQVLITLAAVLGFGGCAYAQGIMPTLLAYYQQQQDDAEPGPTDPGTTGLLARWDFGDADGVSFNDTSGNANHLINSGLQGALLQRGSKSNERCVVDVDASRAAYCSFDLDGHSEWTISCWARPSAAATGLDCIMGDGWNAAGGFAWFYSSAGIGAYLPTATWYGGSAGYVSVSLNTWYHLLVRYDGSTLEYICNGVQVGTLTQARVPATSNKFAVHDSPVATSHRWTGYFDNCTIWTRYLTDAECDWLYLYD